MEIASLKIEIESRSSAILDNPEEALGSILERVAGQIRSGAENGPIFDHNGNRVGYFDLVVD